MTSEPKPHPLSETLPIILYVLRSRCVPKQMQIQLTDN